VRAVTAWALLGSFDWNSLVTVEQNYYEPGPLDVRSSPPRMTAVATLLRELATGRRPSHPVLFGEGWWRRPGRFLCPPVSIPAMDDWVPPAHWGVRSRAYARCAIWRFACSIARRSTLPMPLRSSG